MWVGSWAGVTYLRYTVLTSPNKDETAVHCSAILRYRFLSCPGGEGGTGPMFGYGGVAEGLKS